jgi:hypothetical protein
MGRQKKKPVVFFFEAVGFKPAALLFKESRTPESCMKIDANFSDTRLKRGYQINGEESGIIFN